MAARHAGAGTAGAAGAGNAGVCTAVGRAGMQEEDRIDSVTIHGALQLYDLQQVPPLPRPALAR